jgi:hypothetical protein
MRRGETALRKELNDIRYLESHPEVCQLFKDAGCYRFCEKLQSSHQQVAEAFSLTFDGRKVVIGQDEFIVDEALIAEVTELPRTGESWFKTTVTKDVEFRSYLKPEHKSLIWKKDIPMSFLEDKWQNLLKSILVYITCEGRYCRVMIYHFKLMNHFTGRTPLNLPYYLYRSLKKMAYQVQEKPSKVKGRIFHHGLITLMVCELLKRRNRKWDHFLFWNEFETDFQPGDKEKPSSKKSSTPRSGKRKRRAISPVAVDQPSPSSKPGKAKKKLDFSHDTGKEESPPRDKNILNLPYTDSEDEEQPVATEHEEVVAEQGLLEAVPAGEPVTEHEDLLSQVPKGDQDQQVVEASTNKPKKSSSQKINQLLRQVYELEILEREIKRRNKNLVERNVELYDSFHILAKMYVKLEKKNKKLIQANQKAYKAARCSKIKLMLKNPKPIVHSGLENLAAAAENLAQTTKTLEEQP